MSRIVFDLDAMTVTIPINERVHIGYEAIRLAKDLDTLEEAVEWFVRRDGMRALASMVLLGAEVVGDAMFAEASELLSDAASVLFGYNPTDYSAAQAAHDSAIANLEMQEKL